MIFINFVEYKPTLTDMGIWSFWLILGLAFLIAEVLATSTTCLYIGVGSLAAMCAALAGGQWMATAITFVVATAVLYVGTYRWRARILHFLHKGGAHAATGMDALIGRTGEIEVSDCPRLRIDGDVWQAIPAGGRGELTAGMRVRVVGYDSIVLRVEEIGN